MLKMGFLEFYFNEYIRMIGKYDINLYVVNVLKKVYFM